MYAEKSASIQNTRRPEQYVRNLHDRFCRNNSVRKHLVKFSQSTAEH